VLQLFFLMILSGHHRYRYM